MFAENNSSINYLKLAIMSATCAKNNLGAETKVSVITNQQSLCWFSDEEQEEIFKLFDKVIIRNEWENEYANAGEENLRVYRDTQYHSVSSRFTNKSRSCAYELTPYDETLLIDVDYFILNDSLNVIWGCNEELLINKKSSTLNHESLTGPEFRLNDFGIRMYWATLIYFKKGEKAKTLFGLVEHLKESWHYYKHVYDFAGTLYRNDFAFSIAIHMLNGFIDDEDFAKSFPNPEILTALDLDQFIKFEDKSTVQLFINNRKETYKFFVTKLKRVNFHCLNKISMLNRFDEIMKVIK